MEFIPPEVLTPPELQPQCTRGGTSGVYVPCIYTTDSESDSVSFIHQVLQQGKCLESGKHTSISKQQH